MFGLFKKILEKIKYFFKDNTENVYADEKPEELVKKVMNDGWNRLGGVEK